MAQLLLEHGADANHKNKYRTTPLCDACLGGHAAVVKLLLERGAEIQGDDGDESPEGGGSDKFQEGDVVDVRIQGGDDYNTGMINRDNGDGSYDIIYEVDFVDNETDVAACSMRKFLRSPLAIARREGHAKIITLLENHLHPLHAAANTGDIDAMTQILDGGAAVDQTRGDGETPLWTASLAGRVDAARLLLDRGAEVNRGDDCGQTPLWVASLKGHVDVARLCLERGADANRATEKGTTPLAIARKKGHAAVVALLEEVREA